MRKPNVEDLDNFLSSYASLHVGNYKCNSHTCDCKIVHRVLDVSEKYKKIANSFKEVFYEMGIDGADKMVLKLFVWGFMTGSFCESKQIEKEKR